MEGEFSTSAAPQAAPAPAPAQTSAPSTSSAPVAQSNSQASTNYSANNSASENRSQAPSSSDNKVIAQSGRQQLVVDASGRRVVKINNTPQGAAEQNPQGARPMGYAGQPQNFNAQPLTNDIDDYIRANNIQPEKYNIDQFSEALASGNVDERRVPDQYRSQYETFKINQAVAQYNANQQALEAQKQAQVEQQLTPEQRQQNMANFYTSLDKECSERAKIDAMLTEDDIENLPYMDDDDPKLINYNMAKEFHKQQIMADLQSRAAADRAKRFQQEQTYAGIQNFVTEAKVREPNFDAIDVMMKERYKTLPYAEGQRIATVIEALNNGTITEDQAVELRGYYDNCRREFYANRNGLSTQPQQYNRPPVVERPGGNGAPPAQYVPDYNALRNASGPRERRAWVMQFMRAQANRNR